MEFKYRIREGNRKYYRGEENGRGWTKSVQEAKVYDSLKDLPAELESAEGEVCRKKRVRYNCSGNQYGIRYDPVRSGRKEKNAAPADDGEEKKITVRTYEVLQGRVSLMEILPPDDPIFTRGVIFGGTFSRKVNASSLRCDGTSK